MNTLEELSLYALMGEDFGIWINKNPKFGYDVEIDDESGFPIIRENVHPDAIDSMARFCRMFLRDYERLNKEAA